MPPTSDFSSMAIRDLPETKGMVDRELFRRGEEKPVDLMAIGVRRVHGFGLEERVGVSLGSVWRNRQLHCNETLIVDVMIMFSQERTYTMQDKKNPFVNYPFVLSLFCCTFSWLWILQDDYPFLFGINGYKVLNTC
ncbi:hypothetical protein RHMOL_Rhmol07G0030000 [Rhododendron molle]|uniref:Uncharacterized protein n=1 Tax=Rhododendron molle TaxID=49168 RepID=A0ACC0MWA7_RHOML|nr:hypothetical protein RHMOL_Rhmol07G0030000 [Rhododendron molle]